MLTDNGHQLVLLFLQYHCALLFHSSLYISFLFNIWNQTFYSFKVLQNHLSYFTIPLHPEFPMWELHKMHLFLSYCRLNKFGNDEWDKNSGTLALSKISQVMRYHSINIPPVSLSLKPWNCIELKMCAAFFSIISIQDIFCSNKYSPS
jgi:hypothetical protein